MLNALITPINLLDKYASLGDIHFLLSHLIPIEPSEKYDSIYRVVMSTVSNVSTVAEFEKSLDSFKEESNAELMRKYLEYYRGRNELKILDNGLFENEVAEESLGLIIKALMIKADVVIAPDVLYDAEATIEGARDFAHMVLRVAHKRQFKIMAVPHGKSPEEYLYCYKELVNDAAIDMIGLSILSLAKSFEMYTGTTSIHVNRIVGINYLWSQGAFHPQKWHHLLGLGDRPDELAAYRHIDNIKSNDTSSPVLHGLRGRAYLEDGSIENGKLQQKMNFFEDFKDLSLSCDSLILRNIVSLFKYSKGD